MFQHDGLPVEAAAKMFPSADNDGDGELDAAEFVSIRRLVRAKNVDRAKTQIIVSAILCVSDFPYRSLEVPPFPRLL